MFVPCLFYVVAICFKPSINHLLDQFGFHGQVLLLLGHRESLMNPPSGG